MTATRARRLTITIGDKAVRFERSGGWVVASLPGVPGAYSQGRTQVEAFAMLQDALREIGDLRAAGLVR